MVCHINWFLDKYCISDLDAQIDIRMTFDKRLKKLSRILSSRKEQSNIDLLNEQTYRVCKKTADSEWVIILAAFKKFN